MPSLLEKLFRRHYDTDIMEGYITTDEAAKLSGFTEQYIRKMIREHRIEGKKLRRDWILSKDSLQKFIESERKVGRPPIDKPAK